MVSTVVAPAVPGVTTAGLKLAVAPAGSPVADIVTALLNGPPTGGTVIGILTEPPCAMVNGVCVAVTLKLAPAVTVIGIIAEVDVPEVPLPENTAVML